jgi:CelD/BcsL family acetyltransferase involved in cellulose biosynthesis
MLNPDPWTTISADEYRVAFERFGGSFVVHPRVIALVASLAEHPVRYAGLTRKGELVAAVPLWGEHIAATRLALNYYRLSHLIDVGTAEVVLPVAEDAHVNMPFIAEHISALHADNISNLKHEKNFTSMLAKGLQTGTCRQSGRSQSRRRREIRRLQEIGGRYHPLSEFSSDEVAATFTRLFQKRWGRSPRGKDLLPIVLREFKDMLFGHVLLVGDRPVAIELIYRHKTSRWLFANAVSMAIDPEFQDYSPGSTLMFRNLEDLEHEANASNKLLRFSFGMNRGNYKATWCFGTPVYRLHRPFHLKCRDALTKKEKAAKQPAALHRLGRYR